VVVFSNLKGSSPTDGLAQHTFITIFVWCVVYREIWLGYGCLISL
jgi:hypothetical protein